MKNFKRFIAAMLALCCLCLSFGGTVFADDEQTLPADSDGDFIAAYVDQIAEYLSVYAVDGVSTMTLYRAAMMRVLREHPELYDSVMDAMLSSIDQYSVYYPGTEEFNSFITNLEGKVGGIGITFNEVGENLVVGTVYENSPASAAGILPGDILYSANGTNLIGATIDAAKELIRGEIGTIVELGILRGDSGEPINFTIVRDEIAEKLSVTYNILSGADESDPSINRNVMYIKIYSFMDNSAEQFAAALAEADKQGITDIIIDVRDNGGGYIIQAVDIAENFVPKGNNIVTEDHKVDLFDIVYTSNNESDKKYDLTVLVNENTASASEILAAAVQENEVGAIIGTNTYGKGTVQSMVSLKDGEAMKYTSANYLTPTGRNIDKIGITPDSVVENTYIPFDSSGYANFDYSAVYEQGMSDENVARAKKMFAVWDQYSGDVDDPYFDAELADAITLFQASKGLFPYGVLDITTQLAVYQALVETKELVDEQLLCALRHYGINISE